MISADGIPSDTFSKHPLHLRYIGIYTHRDCIYIYNEHTENVNRKYTVYRFKNMYIYVYFRNFSFAQSRT